MPLAEIAATAEMLYYFDEDIINAFDRHSGETIYDQLIKTGEDMEPMVQIEKMNPYCIAGFVFGYVINSPKLHRCKSSNRRQSLPGIKRLFEN